MTVSRELKRLWEEYVNCSVECFNAKTIKDLKKNPDWRLAQDITNYIVAHGKIVNAEEEAAIWDDVYSDYDVFVIDGKHYRIEDMPSVFLADAEESAEYVRKQIKEANQIPVKDLPLNLNLNNKYVSKRLELDGAILGRMITEENWNKIKRVVDNDPEFLRYVLDIEDGQSTIGIDLDHAPYKQAILSQLSVAEEEGWCCFDVLGDKIAEELGMETPSKRMGI